MENYIATFFTHFAAVNFKRELRKLGIDVILSPVPRSLSSSCGTCARFSTADLPTELPRDELEKLVCVVGEKFKVVIDNG